MERPGMPLIWKVCLVILVLCLIASIAIGTVRLIEL
jgi:Na+-transporting NADH:ubiquinone oxidoreductase subunit NqrC